MFPLRSSGLHSDENDLKAGDSGLKVLMQALVGVLLVVAALVIGLYLAGFVRF